MEAQINQGGSWTPAADTTVNATGTSFRFGGDSPGRWRVTAVAPDGTPGTPSGWSTFRYDTRIQAFVGTWTNVNPRTDGVLDLQTMVVDPPTSPTLTQVHPTDDGGHAIGHGDATLSGGELDNGPSVGFFASVYTYRMTLVNGQMVVRVHVEFLRGGTPRDFTDTLRKG
jgi:hypothetical protein